MTNVLEFNGAQVEVYPDYEALSQAAASLVVKRVAQNPNMSLLVPTGSTPEGLYDLLSRENESRFAGVAFYNLDEYCEADDTDGNVKFSPIDPNDPQSYQRYMREHVLDALPTIRSFFPGIENLDNPGTYDRLIRANGGIDLAINGLGEDGHVFGFNSPGSDFNSITRLVSLSSDTVKVNEQLTGLAVPSHAISTGIGTGMKAKEVVTLVSGERKADTLAQAVWNDISPDMPATILRSHLNHRFMVDEAASSRL